MAAPRTAPINLDDNPSWLIVLHDLNKLVYDTWYYIRNHAGTVAPGAAIGAGGVKVKTTNNTTYVRGGAPRALAATDNFWDLTTASQGVAVVPISSFIKYRLIATAAEAQKVQSSTVAAAAASCDFGTVPMADGDVILATALVATDGAHPFTPGTTHLDAAGITTTYTDGSDGSEIIASQRIE